MLGINRKLVSPLRKKHTHRLGADKHHRLPTRPLLPREVYRLCIGCRPDLYQWQIDRLMASLLDSVHPCLRIGFGAGHDHAHGK